MMMTLMMIMIIIAVTQRRGHCLLSLFVVIIVCTKYWNIFSFYFFYDIFFKFFTYVFGIYGVLGAYSKLYIKRKYVSQLTFWDRQEPIVLSICNSLRLQFSFSRTNSRMKLWKLLSDSYKFWWYLIDKLSCFKL